MASSTDVTDATNAGTTIEVTTDQNGMAACRWRLGGDSSDVCQRARASAEGLDLLPVVFNANLSLADRVAYDPADCPSLQAANVTTVQQAIDALCNLGQPDDPGIKITDVLVHLTNRSLVNDGDLLMGDLEQGLQVVCDQKIDPVTIGRPTCYVTLEHPFFIAPDKSGGSRRIPADRSGRRRRRRGNGGGRLYRDHLGFPCRTRSSGFRAS